MTYNLDNHKLVLPDLCTILGFEHPHLRPYMRYIRLKKAGMQNQISGYHSVDMCLVVHIWGQTVLEDTALSLSQHSPRKERSKKILLCTLTWRLKDVETPLEFDSRFHDSLMATFFVLFSRLSHCLLPLKLQAKFPLTSEEVGWRQ